MARADSSPHGQWHVKGGTGVDPFQGCSGRGAGDAPEVSLSGGNYSLAQAV